ncbi:hypothetical protein jhhlp_006834 [Lomentospora prolificans]|uniref:RING-type domain-containing protein n=1 Tax=Lomentospora prolificans TaxID=41688 RepID=A0A2N3N2V7_9PEZI|nr:hypothetical protein jhhlp_006834 [Lomentospora prolificans]
MAEPATGDAPTVSRCFICLGDASEEGDISDWVHPCPCSLEAHHACLLEWVDECERESKPLKCPVCQAPIRVEGAKDLAIELNDGFRNFINGLSPVLIGSMFGGAVMAGQALYGFHAIRVFAGEEAVLKILGTGRLRDHVPALLGVPMIAPGLIFYQLFPTFSTAISTPFSIMFSATFVRNADPLVWPPTPQLAFASLPCLAMAYIKLKDELFGRAEARWDRIIRGLPETPDQDNGAPDRGVGGGLRDIINNLADNLGGPEDAPANERMEIWFDDGEDGHEAELIIDVIEEVTDDEEDGDGHAEGVQIIPLEQAEQPPNGAEPRQPLEQQEAGAEPAPGPAPAPIPQPEQRRNQAAAVDRAVRYSLRDLTSTILGALLLPSISWAAGEMLRLALPKAWTTMRVPNRPFFFASSMLGGPTGLLQEQWGRSLSTTPKQRLALAICDFLTKSLSDGTLAADDKDNVDVAINCIADSFKVDPATSSASAADESLLQIFTSYESTRGASAPEPSDEQKREAESLKSRGNAAMAAKDYTKAIELYTQALNLHPRNAVFLSNRAAAYSAAKDHESARSDAESAVAIDPRYTKAWSRLGLARFALGDPRGSMEAYQKGIEYEGNGGSDAMKKGYETAKRRVDELEGEGNLSPRDRASPATSPGAGAGGMPDLSNLANMFGGGAGGAGGPGGMDFSSIMSNPMFQNMAQSLMNNPDMMSSLMSNPRLREMANQIGSGGGMPDISAMMNDPTIAEMARSMMGGGGPGSAGGAGNPGSGNNSSN